MNILFVVPNHMATTAIGSGLLCEMLRASLFLLLFFLSLEALWVSTTSNTSVFAVSVVDSRGAGGGVKPCVVVKYRVA